MIKIKSAHEIDLMKKAGKITAKAMHAAKLAVIPGVTTKDIDDAVKEAITKAGAIPSFLGYNGFPGNACVSVNEQVIHGIPGKRMLCDGDIVKVDIGACIKGYHGDSAATFTVGKVSDNAEDLIKITRQSFYEGIRFARPGYRISDISYAVQEYVEKNGYSVVRKFVGHGIGSNLHEAPEVPNYGHPGRGVRLIPGMTIAVEPMVNEGGYDVDVLEDGWTVVTSDGKLSAHYEHTVLITDNEPIILTAGDEGL